MKLSLALLLLVSAVPLRADDAAPKGKAVPRLADLVCRVEKRISEVYPGDLSGTLDIDSLELQENRSGGRDKPISEPREDKAVDERCGKVVSPLADNYNYYVTPRHYWGEDILQLPKSSLSGAGKSAFKAQLHLCQYDGDWSHDWDVVLDCTLTAR